MSTYFELVTKTADGAETVDVLDFEKIVRFRVVRSQHGVAELTIMFLGGSSIEQRFKDSDTRADDLAEAYRGYLRRRDTLSSI